MPAKKKRPLNEFMKRLIKAKKNNDESFEYKSKDGVKSYRRQTTKTGMIIYKAVTKTPKKSKPPKNTKNTKNTKK